MTAPPPSLHDYQVLQAKLCTVLKDAGRTGNTLGQLIGNGVMDKNLRKKLGYVNKQLIRVIKMATPLSDYATFSQIMHSLIQRYPTLEDAYEPFRLFFLFAKQQQQQQKDQNLEEILFVGQTQQEDVSDEELM